MNKIEPRTWTHTFLQGPDEERLRELRADADRLQDAAESAKKQAARTPQTADEEDPYVAAREAADAKATEADEFAVEAESRGVPVVMRSVGRRTWRDLVNANPPRDGDEKDQDAGVNLDAFREALVPACLASPALPDFEREEFLDSLTEAQFDLLATAAWSLNKNLGADPKERLRSAPAPS